MPTLVGCPPAAIASAAGPAAMPSAEAAPCSCCRLRARPPVAAAASSRAARRSEGGRWPTMILGLLETAGELLMERVREVRSVRQPAALWCLHVCCSPPAPLSSESKQAGKPPPLASPQALELQASQLRSARPAAGWKSCPVRGAAQQALTRQLPPYATPAPPGCCPDAECMGVGKMGETGAISQSSK